MSIGSLIIEGLGVGAFVEMIVPTYGYTFDEMSLEMGKIFYHHPHNWGSISIFPAIFGSRICLSNFFAM